MNRVYIASQIFGTVHVADGIPAESRLFGRPLGISIEEGPSVDNRRPPRMVATRALSRLCGRPYRYTTDDCDFLAAAPLGTWQKRCDGVWEQLTA